MPTTNLNFTTLNGSDPAGHESINTLISSIDTKLNTIASALTTAHASPGSLTTGQVMRWNGTTFAAGLVNAASLATNAVTADKIDTDAVTNSKIQDGAVTSAKIQNGTITETDLAFSVATQAELDDHASDTTSVHGITDTSALALKSGNTYTGTHNFSGATLTGNASSATTATNLSGGSAASVPYQSATGVTAMLANGTAGQVLTSNGTTVAPSWQNASIGEANIANNAITQAKMADNSVGTAEIIDANVTYAKLASNAKTYSVATTATAGLHFSSSGNFTTASLSTSSSQNPLVITTNGSAITLTIPYQLTAIPGTTITVCRYEPGNVTISASNGTSGTQLNGVTSGTASIAAQYSIVTLILLPDVWGDGLDHWIITGDYI